MKSNASAPSSLPTGARIGLFLISLLIATPARSQLEEVVVTTTRRAENIQDVPSSVSALSGHELEQLRILDIVDLQQQVPGLNLNRGSGRSQVRAAIRGLSNRAFEENAQSHVNIYLDDVIINNPFHQGVPIFDLERVEVARGPQGTLLGRNVTGGAIQYVSRKPRFGEQNGYFLGTYGRFNEIVIEGAAGGSLLGDRVAARVSTQVRQRDDFIFNEYTDSEDTGDFSDVAGRLHLMWQPNDDLALLFTGFVRQLEGDASTYHQFPLVGEAAVTTTPGPGVPVSPDGNAILDGSTDVNGFSEPAGTRRISQDAPSLEESRQTMLTLKFDWQAAGGTLTGVTGWMDGETSILADDDISPYSEEVSLFVPDVEQFTQELRFASAVGERVEWIVGAYYFYERLDSFGGFVFPPSGPQFGVGGFTPFSGILDRVQTTDAIAGFGTLNFDVNERLRLSGGIRYTHEKKSSLINAYFFTPDFEGGLIRAFDPDTVGAVPFVFQDISDTYDEPTGDLSAQYWFTDSTQAYFRFARGFLAGRPSASLFGPVGGVTLDSETLNSYELGLKTEFNDRSARLNAAAFYYDYSDIQVTEAIVGFSRGLNAESGRVIGGELEAQFDLGARWYVSTGLSYADTEFTSDDITITNPFDNFVGQPETLQIKGNDFIYAPEFTANVLARYTHPLGDSGRLILQTDWSYFDSQESNLAQSRNTDLARSLRLDSYVLGNLSLRWETGDGRFHVTAWARNLGDEEYTTNHFAFADLGFAARTYGDPRTWGMTIGGSFF